MIIPRPASIGCVQSIPGSDRPLNAQPARLQGGAAAVEQAELIELFLEPLQAGVFERPLYVTDQRFHEQVARGAGSGGPTPR